MADGNGSTSDGGAETDIAATTWWGRTRAGLGKAFGWAGGLFRPHRPGSNELLDNEWSTLEGLWRVCRPAAMTADPIEAAAIDVLFEARTSKSDGRGWSRFNDAERRVGAFLTAAQLPIEFGTLLQIATARALPTLAFHKGNEALFSDPAKLDSQRAAYAALLVDLQTNFINTRFQRALRSEVAARLFRYGVIIILLAALAPLVLVWDQLNPVPTDPKHPLSITAVMTRFSNEPLFALTMVATFGILGAYFSRAIAFQTGIRNISFDDVMTTYVGRVLRMRLLYGMIGAIVFYFVLRGNLVGGSLFPDLKKIGIGEQVVWKLTADGVVPDSTSGALTPSGLTILSPTLDMAKLLVWSFIAGFSERLVPDTLARTEAQATKES